MTKFLRRTLRMSRPYWPLVTMVLVTIVYWSAFQTLLPFSMRLIIDRAIVPHDARVLRTILIVLPAAFVIYVVVLLVGERAHVRLTASVVKDIRLNVFSHLQALSLDYHSRVRPGDITARFSQDLGDIEYALTYTLHHGVASVLSIIGAVIVLFTLAGWLAAAAVGGLAIVLCIPRLMAPGAERANLTNKEELGLLQDIVSENLQAQAVVKAFGLERRVIDAFRLRLGTVFGYGVRAHFLTAMLERVPTLTVTALNVLVMCAGAWLTFLGQMTLGALVSFVGLFALLSDAVTTLMWALPFLVRASAAQKRIDEILDEVPTVADPPTPVPVPAIARGISLCNVTFGYQPDTQILDDVSLDIPRGASVAVVGGSGCGKSTILRLLLRTYDPWSGSVLVDDVDVRSVAQEDLRSRFGVVLQDNFLFNTSVRDNIRIVEPDATDDAVIEAAKAAEVHDAISALPDGYDTPVGDRGTRLSPGQRQRIGIARALLRRPDIMLLDEATSALDAASEAAVNKTVERLSGDRTVVAITHRLASVVKADIVVVMDRGRVVGQGTHNKLVSTNEIYRELWEKQTRFLAHADGLLEPEALRNIDLFSHLDDISLRAIGILLIREQHPAFSDVMLEGDEADKLYLIARGSVEVYRSGSDEQPVVLADGDHFGEVALLDRTMLNASVRTRGPTTLLTLNRDAFLSLVAADPDMRAKVEETARRRRI